MALQIDRESVPGTEQLIDGMQAHSHWYGRQLTKAKVNHKLDSGDHVGQSDIVLIPKPTSCGSDPLVSRARNPFPYITESPIDMVQEKEILSATPSRSICLRLFIR